MSFSFSTSLSGLNANSTALGVVGNNIANSNTIGFRSASATFADIFASSTGARLNGAGNSLQVGNGVRTAAVHTNFSQGGLTESGSPLHAAIQGNGFFVARDNAGALAYTRAGDFTLNNQGYLVTSSGSKVQGYQATDGTVQPGTPLSALQLPLGATMQPQMSSEATLRLNLNSEAKPGDSFNATLQVYDSRGAAHTLNLTFTKQANGSFKMNAALDGAAAQANGGANVDFTFDNDGKLTAPTGNLNIVPDQTKLNGANLPSIDIKLRETNPDGTPGAFNITSYAQKSAVSSTAQNGYPAGEMQSAALDQDGNVFGVFSNGQTRIVGQLALATFNAPEGLNRIGGSMFSETLASGQATIGEPNAGGRGSIAAGYVEQSNVNITNEFIDLIEAQRGFQANSRVISTVNQTFQDLLQIV